MNYVEAVREFHEAYGLPAPDQPTWPDLDLASLRLKLIDEEFAEVIEAMFSGTPNIAHLGKEIADLIYVAVGLGVSIGLPMDEIFAEVHRSNMSKLGEDGKPIYREDGKVLKGPNYTPADIEGVLFPQ